MTRLLLRRILVAAGLCGLLGCQAPGTTSRASSLGSQRSEQAASASAGPSRDLSQDEAAGGHILRKHVGRTDDQLLERLDRERNISGASTIDHPCGPHVSAECARRQLR